MFEKIAPPRPYKIIRIKTQGIPKWVGFHWFNKMNMCLLKINHKVMYAIKTGFPRKTDFEELAKPKTPVLQKWPVFLGSLKITIVVFRFF